MKQRIEGLQVANKTVFDRVDFNEMCIRDSSRGIERLKTSKTGIGRKVASSIIA